MNVCADIELLKAKVPRICPSTAGVPARREGRYLKSILRACYLDLKHFGFPSAPPKANQKCAFTSEQGVTSRGLVGANNRTTDSMFNTALSLVGG
jgi:hypothetical protein